jgi:hypothetical protein
MDGLKENDKVFLNTRQDWFSKEDFLQAHFGTRSFENLHESIRTDIENMISNCASGTVVRENEELYDEDAYMIRFDNDNRYNWYVQKKYIEPVPITISEINNTEDIILLMES